MSNSVKNATRSHISKKDRCALYKLNADNKQGYHHKRLYINESGLYSFMMGSRKEPAKRFRNWVVGIVLPSIRKTGSYKLLDEHKKNLDGILEKINCVEEERKKISLTNETRGIVYVLDYSTDKDNRYKICTTSDAELISKIRTTKKFDGHKIVHLTEFNHPTQLIACTKIFLHKRKVLDRNLYACSLNIIKDTLTKYMERITKNYNKPGGSKTNKKSKSKNLVLNTLLSLKKEEHKLKMQINNLEKSKSTNAK